MLLDRSAILAAKDLKSEDVDVPEWGGSVRLRAMTGTLRNALGAAVLVNGKADMHRYRLGLVAACLVGDDGAPLFAIDELQLLSDKSSVALERVVKVAEALNSVQPMAVEGAEKNSLSGPSDGSSSDGPSSSAAPPPNSSPA